MTEDSTGAADVPEGFVPQGRSSPFLAPFEPIWEKPFAADTPHGRSTIMPPPAPATGSKPASTTSAPAASWASPAAS